MKDMQIEHLPLQEEQSQDHHMESSSTEEELMAQAPPVTGNKQWKALYHELTSYAKQLRSSNKQSVE